MNRDFSMSMVVASIGLLVARASVAQSRLLTPNEMASIYGTAEYDCTELADSEECKANNPCKDCKESAPFQGDPAACPKDNEIVDYYPGAALNKCKTVGTANKYCHINAGTLVECFKKYRCTSDGVVADKRCDGNSQCGIVGDSDGFHCRRCKLGTPESTTWNMRNHDTCTSTSP